MSAADSAMTLRLESNSGVSIACKLKRHLSPGTVGLIARSLPLSGNVHTMGKSITYIETNLKSGIERARNDFKRGDIAFHPAEGSICFIHGNVSTPRTMTPIGTMVDYSDELGLLGSGDVLTLRLDS